MEKKQSSLDYLIEQLEGENNRIAMVVGVKKYNSIVKEAKAMHKEEIKDAISVGYNMATPSEPYDNLHKGDKYYIEAYGGDDE